MFIQAKYDPLLFKCPKGAVKKNTKVKYFVEFSGDAEPNIAYFMLKNDNDEDYKYIQMNRTKEGFVFEYNFENQGHYWYNFQFVYNDFCMYLNKTFDSYSNLSYDKGEDYLQLVLEKEYECSNSMQGGIIYQIYVDRFCRVGDVKNRKPLKLRNDWGGNICKNTTDPIEINLEVFGGNFKGIISKIDYLKELGVTTIYLNPISQANSNHKYNTSNYMKIDDMFGTETEFKKLVETAKNNNIKIVIDGVYNHTGSDSIYFNKDGNFDTLGAYKSTKSRFYSWYDFEEYPDKYRSWWGIDTLPSIRSDCKEFQDYIAGENGVLDKFLKLGVSGVRLDVVDEITDEFVKKIEQRVHKYDKNNVVMGEVWEDASTKISYSNRRKYFCNNELNSVMNYPIKESILEFLRSKNSFSLNSTIRMIENNYPKAVRDNLMNFLTTHDTSRIFSELKVISGDNEELAKQYYKIAMTLIFTLPGVPSIFYGDEYGMLNNDGSSRGCFDWNNYSNEIFCWLKTLTKIRNYSVLKDGEINVLYSSNGKFVFERTKNQEKIVVMINLSNSKLDINLEGKFISFFDNKEANNFVLNENEFKILISKKTS